MVTLSQLNAGLQGHCLASKSVLQVRQGKLSDHGSPGLLRCKSQPDLVPIGAARLIESITLVIMLDTLKKS
jgi:hypothetical protein